MWRLGLTLSLTATYMAAELVGGVMTGSLALLADAGHMFSDAAALGLSLFAMWVAAKRSGNAQKTFGYYRTEILAALVNGAALVAIALLILLEALQRLRHPPEVLGSGMLAVAAGGLGVNLIGLRILSGARAGSLNVQGAWLHLFSDALGSAAASVSGALIWAFDWRSADVFASLVIGLLVIYSSWSLLKETVAVLMEWAPGHINVDAVRDTMARVDGVVAVHDLHIWTITTGMESLSSHIVVDDGTEPARVLVRVRELLRESFGIHHVTLQIEPEDFAAHTTCD